MIEFTPKLCRGRAAKGSEFGSHHGTNHAAAGRRIHVGNRMDKTPPRYASGSCRCSCAGRGCVPVPLPSRPLSLDISFRVLGRFAVQAKQLTKIELSLTTVFRAQRFLFPMLPATIFPVDR